MNTTQDNKNIEQEVASLDNPESGAGSESLDSEHEGAEQEKSSPDISVDDFEISEEKKPETEKKTVSQEENAINIQDKTFQKYGVDFENYPEDLKWTIEGIKERYTQNPVSEEKEEIDINSLVEKGVNEKLAEQDFKNQLQALVDDENISAEKKNAIKEKYLYFRNKGYSSKIEALADAKEFIIGSSETKKIVGVFPQQGDVPKSTIKTISQEALSKLSGAEYNATMDKVDNGELIIK